MAMEEMMKHPAQFPALYDGLIKFDTTIKRMKFK
jgi:hypothetical protein